MQITRKIGATGIKLKNTLSNKFVRFLWDDKFVPGNIFPLDVHSAPFNVK